MLRVVMSCPQSLIKYKNPYGDMANELMRMLNVAWSLREFLGDQLTDTVRVEVDKQIAESLAFMNSIKEARPWDYSPLHGYYFIDKSASNWEGFKDHR
jgi:hypothetical protein